MMQMCHIRLKTGQIGYKWEISCVSLKSRVLINISFLSTFIWTHREKKMIQTALIFLSSNSLSYSLYATQWGLNVSEVAYHLIHSYDLTTL